MSVFTIFKPGSTSQAGLVSGLAGQGVIVHTGAEFAFKDPSIHTEGAFFSAAGDPFTYFPFPANEIPSGGTIASITVSDGPSYTKHWQLSGLSISLSDAVQFVETHPNAPAVVAYLLNLEFGGNDAIRGSYGSDVLRGYAGNDRITGGQGNDVMFGNAGSDTFVFGPGFGHDVIRDFSPAADVFEMHHLFHSLAAVKSHSHVDAHGHVDIVWDAANSITLTSVHSKAALTAADFHFFA